MVSACITQNEGSQIKPQIITIQQETVVSACITQNDGSQIKPQINTIQHDRKIEKILV